LSTWMGDYAAWGQGYGPEREGEGEGAQKEEGDECEELHSNDKIFLKNLLFLGFIAGFGEF
jgi:hypothetical protein